MELLALVLVNIVFGFVLYYIISIKLLNSVKEYQNGKLKKEIQLLSIEFYKESENYLALMDSRITSLKNLLSKADSLGIKFDDLDEIPEKEKIVLNTKSKTIQERIKFPIDEKKTQVKDEEDEGSFNSIVAGIGKGFKSVFGMNEEEVADRKATTKKNSTINVRIGGNPFLDQSVIESEKELTDFNSILKTSLQKEILQPADKVSISVSSALKEIPENSAKVEKVVHLLKKGFTHLEISEAIGLAIPEISLIEIIKLEKNRRI